MGISSYRYYCTIFNNEKNSYHKENFIDLQDATAQSMTDVFQKPGTCPVLPPDTVGTCATECGVDSDCPGVKKCCHNNCAHVCTYPKPEFCPLCCGPPPCCSTCINTERCACEIGEPQPNVYCNSSNQLVCAKSYYCKIFSSNEDFGVCCKVPHCPVDPGPNSNCYGHYQRYCNDDLSCPPKTKCCKQGCSYKCVDAV